MHLPLQLPVVTERAIDLLFCALGRPPVRFRVIVARGATIAALKAAAADLFGVAAQNLIFREVVCNRFVELC